MTSPLIRPFPLEAGHPANHGYTRCTKCGAQRLRAALYEQEKPGGLACFDIDACARFKRERVRHQSDARGTEVMYLDAYVEDLMREARRIALNPSNFVIEAGEKRCPHGVRWEHGGLLCAPCAKAGGG